MAIDVEPVARPIADRHPDGPPPPPPGAPAGVRERVEPLLIRLHFLSGFLVAPIVISLALSGILFAWNPQIESVLHRDTLSATSAEDPVPLSEQVRAAQEAHPDYEVTEVTPAAPGVFQGKETTAVAMKPADAAEGSEFGHASGALSVYVDPGTGEVTGGIDEAQRPAELLRNLHSSWLLGDNVAPLTELAASWVIVSMLTGLYLRWPALRRSLVKTLTPQLRQPGWRRAQALHTTFGLWLTVALIGLIVTGLSWTTFAGSRIDDLRATVSRPDPVVSTSLTGEAPAAGGEHAEHGADGGEAAADAPPFPVNEVSVEQIDTVADGAADAGIAGLLNFTPPSADGAAWEVEKRDQLFPMRPVKAAIDGESGEMTDRVDWSEKPLMGKLTSMGISFHQAELFGVGTQVYMTLLTIALLVLIAAGYRMWWLRRPPGSWGFPPRAGPLWRTVPIPVIILFGVFIYAMPMLGISLLAYLVIERIVRAARSARRRSDRNDPPAPEREKVPQDA